MTAWLRIPLLILTVTLLGVLATVSLITGAYFYAEPSLPQAEQLQEVSSSFAIPMRVHSRDGRLMQQYGEQKRTPARFEDIPRLLVDAVVAAEDDSFWDHPGFDILSTLRAVANYGISYITGSDERVPGASTITQQIARTTNLLPREYALGRKIKEIFLAYRIEKEFDKEDIIELYLNTYEFGHRSFGVVSTARTYFNKQLDELTLSEIAIIAGIPQGPSIMNPYTSPERADERRRYVLRRMRELGLITESERQQALTEPIISQLFDVETELSAPYVADMVYSWCLDRFGKETCDTEGLSITTTVDSRLQRAANRALQAALEKYDREHGYRGPIARIDLEDLDSGSSLTDALDAYLGDFPVEFNAEAGVVLATSDLYADVYFESAGLVSLGFDSMDWARRLYVNDNRYELRGSQASEILEVGDVVRFRRDAEGVYQLFQVPDVEGALVSVDPLDGAVVSLVGGYNFTKSSFNRATQALRQPGSSFKPFFYLSALDAGYSLATIVNDAPFIDCSVTLEECRPVQNYGGRYYGEVSLRFALTNSLNAVADRIVRDILPRNSIRYMERFGFKPEALPNNASLALGSGGITPLDLAGAYAILANGGFAVGVGNPDARGVSPYFVQRVENSDGEVIYDSSLSVDYVCPEPDAAETDTPLLLGEDLLINRPSELFPPLRCAELVESPQRIFLITDVLKDVVRRGSGAAAGRAFPRRSDLAGKTGTTTGPRDAWFAGFNADIVAIVRVGFDRDSRELGHNEQGGVTAIPAWIDFMQEALQGQPDHSLPRPPGVVERRVNSDTGLVAADCNREADFEYFLIDNVPPRESDTACFSIDALPAETESDRDPEPFSLFE